MRQRLCVEQSVCGAGTPGKVLVTFGHAAPTLNSAPRTVTKLRTRSLRLTCAPE
jgi:hypothetical protein